jgi:hypothetical protein
MWAVRRFLSTRSLYHLKLRCYVVIELKAGKFKPEHLGQLGFYLTTVDWQVKAEQDNPSIGLRWIQDHLFSVIPMGGRRDRS